MQGIILAGGYGERLKPLTLNKRKPFIKLLGRPLYEYTIDYMKKARLSDIAVVGRKGDEFHYDNGRLHITTLYQEGYSEDQALRTAFENIKTSDDYVVSFTGFIASPDNIIELALRYHMNSDLPNTMIVTPIVSGLETYGMPVIRDGNVEDFQPHGKGKHGYVFAGTMILNKQGMKTLAELGFSHGLRKLAKEGRLGAYVWSGEWAEIGYPWDLLEASAILLGSHSFKGVYISSSAKVSDTAVIKGPAYIGNKAYVDENAYIKGPAYIGEGSFIGFQSFIREYSVIEPNALLGSRNEIKRSIIMEEARTGTGVVIADSIIGMNTDIGEYTVVKSTYLDNLPPRLRDKVFYKRKKPKMGSIIGPYCKVDALSKIEPGTIMECRVR